MKISVIIPFWNSAHYLPEAVDSVLAQNYPEWELLLVDDGSTDGGDALAIEYAKKDPLRIRFFPSEGKDSKGASAARNRGIAEAKGECIAFLDADDVWLPGKLARQAEILGQHREVAMTFARVRYFHDDVSQGGEKDQTFGPLREGIYLPPDLTKEFLRDSDVYPCPSASLIRTEALRKISGFEEQFRLVRTDLAVWVKLSCNFPVYADPAIVTRYRQHGQSSVARMMQNQETFDANELLFAEWLANYVEALPSGRGLPLEGLACKRLYRSHMLLTLAGGSLPPAVWRWRMARRLWKYPVFRRRARMIRLLLFPSRWAEGAFA